MDDLPDADLTALLGRGTRFEGKLFFQGRLRIDGDFKGLIQSADGSGSVLVIGGEARVEAEIKVASVIVRGGEIEGSIVATESIELYVPARVAGDLQAPEIFMDKGVEFKGTCTICKDNVSTETQRAT